MMNDLIQHTQQIEQEGFTCIPGVFDLLLHASNRTTNQARRRVIHIEFSNVQLPYGLNWSETIS